MRRRRVREEREARPVDNSFVTWLFWPINSQPFFFFRKTAILSNDARNEAPVCSNAGPNVYNFLCSMETKLLVHFRGWLANLVLGMRTIQNFELEKQGPWSFTGGFGRHGSPWVNTWSVWSVHWLLARLQRTLPSWLTCVRTLYIGSQFGGFRVRDSLKFVHKT